jgi:hypothetical protein
MTVRLPDGSLEQIRYSGNQPPQVVFPRRHEQELPTLSAFDAFDADSPFADLDRISAAMDRETSAMLAQADALERMSSSPDNLIRTGFSTLPPGTEGYTVVSTMSGNNACTRTIRYFSSGKGKPQVETSSSGHCGAMQGSMRQAAHLPLAKPAIKKPQSKLIEASYHPNTRKLKPPAYSKGKRHSLGNWPKTSIRNGRQPSRCRRPEANCRDCRTSPDPIESLRFQHLLDCCSRLCESSVVDKY